jgi:hypothetical protein
MSRITHARALGIDGQAQAQLDLANETLRMIREDRDSASTEPDALDLIALAHLRLDNPLEARTAAAEAIALVVARQTYGFGIWAYGTLARAQLAIGEATEQIEQTLDDYAVAIEHTGMHLFDAEVAELRAVVQNRSRSTQ